VIRGGISGAAQFDVSRNGTLVYLTGEQEAPRNLVWVDRAGREEMIRAPARYYYTPKVSPDGKRVVIYSNDAERDLWVWDFARETLTRLTATPATELNGVWTPDGQRVVFNSDHEGTRALYWRAADGTGTVERLLKDSDPLWPLSIAANGERLVYGRGPLFFGTDLHMLTLDAQRRSEPLIETEFNEANAEISPDGKWLAYGSNLSGRDEVYVQAFPVGGGRWPISTAGGKEPLWSPDGRELFYRTETEVMSVPVKTTDGFAAGAPARVVADSYESGGGRGYDISLDGKRFLMLKAAERIDPDGGPARLRQIVVVQRWFEDLNTRAPLR
jgi:Tol biopolymer transport system component